VTSDVAPARSDIVLVTTNHYKDNGDANAVTDPMGIQTRWDNDQAGRRVRLIKNFVEHCPEQSRISEYAWNSSGQLQQLTLVNSDTGNQVTQWIYGVTLPGSAIASNNLLQSKIYPESADRPLSANGSNAPYAQLLYAYNRQGQKTTFTDADGTVHDYAYDRLGRSLADAVTTLGSGLDHSVLCIGRTYEVRGMLATGTSYATASPSETVVNELALTYDPFRNLTQDQQSHSGAVRSGSPAVSYAYADGSANTVRRTTTTYPSGQALDIQYGTTASADDHFNRVTALQLEGESSPLVSYTYVGLAWQVQVAYPEPAVELTYEAQGSEPYGDAGDPYNGYNRFGRTVDIRWQSTTTEDTQLERILYGYDRDSRRIWRMNVLTTNEDNAYTYDGLSQGPTPLWAISTPMPPLSAASPWPMNRGTTIRRATGTITNWPITARSASTKPAPTIKAIDSPKSSAIPIRLRSIRWAACWRSRPMRREIGIIPSRLPGTHGAVSSRSPMQATPPWWARTPTTA
jgi:YD repeat-containing protein